MLKNREFTEWRKLSPYSYTMIWDAIVAGTQSTEPYQQKLFGQRGREREKHRCERESSIGCLLYVPGVGNHSAWFWTRDQGSNLQPRQGLDIQRREAICHIYGQSSFASCPFLPGSHPTVVHVHESFFLFVKSLHPLTSPHLAVFLFSIYESVSILLVSSVCSLDSTYE